MKKRRKRKSIKNIILKISAYTMAIIFFVSGCALDSESLIPFFLCFGSAAWLALMAYSNNLFYGQEDRR